ncbi:MAG: hypothetical protein P8R54_02820 [Myxococcota bacterium]|nr:hypothetical protein [Myxococcota bacterium]
MNTAMTPDEIRALISSQLHSEAHFFVTPDAPPEKVLTRVRQIHDIWLADDEPILALYDDTLLGSGADGFALTTQRLVWRNFLEHPRQIRWVDLEPAAVKHEDDDLIVAESRLSTSAIRQCAALAEVLAVLGERHHSADLLHASEPLRPATILKLARGHIGEQPAIFYAPALPDRKLRTVRTLHRLPEDERVLVIIDDTLFGSASEGVVITSQRVCWKHLLDPPDAMLWSEMKPRKDGKPVISGLQLTLQSDLLMPLHTLLRAVAQERSELTGRVYCWSCRGEVRLRGGKCSGCGRIISPQDGSD